MDAEMNLPSLGFASGPYGDVPIPAAPTAPSTIDTLRAYIPLVGETIAAASIGGDVRVQAATLKAKIENLTDMKRQFPVMAFYYDNEINKKQAQLTALQGSLGRQMETETAAAQVKTITTVGVGLAVLAAAGLAAVLVAGAIRVAKG